MSGQNTRAAESPTGIDTDVPTRAAKEPEGLQDAVPADETAAAKIAKPDIYSAAALASAVEIVTGAVSVEPSSLEVRRSNKHEFFRASPDPRHWLQAQVLAIKDEDSGLKPDLYPVMPAVITHLMELTQPYEFVLAVNRRNRPFLIPVPGPSRRDGERHRAHQDLHDAVQQSRERWVRLTWVEGGYEIATLDPRSQLSLQPRFPDYAPDTILRLGFRGRIIADLTHPAFQRLGIDTSD
jgi:hypothetical protein